MLSCIFPYLSRYLEEKDISLPTTLGGWREKSDSFLCGSSIANYLLIFFYVSAHGGWVARKSAFLCVLASVWSPNDPVWAQVRHDVL